MRASLCVAAIISACAWARPPGEATSDAARAPDARVRLDAAPWSDARATDAPIVVDAAVAGPDAATYAPLAFEPLAGSFGGLSAFVHVPAGMPVGVARPLVVVLHGCWEDARTHATNAGWDALADARHLYVLHAQDGAQVQQCFDWWSAASQDGGGDAAGVIAMIDAARARWSIDDAHVWLDGFSSGAGLAVILCATYPARFAGALIHAGVPYRGYTGTDVGTLGYIFSEHDQTPAARAAVMPGAGPYPPIVAFVGAADTTVHPTFTRELMEQWTQAQGADQSPEREGRLKPDHAHHVYREYRDSGGRLIIATVTIDAMPHGYAVDPHGTGADAGGATSGTFGGHAAYGKDVGLWSTYWGAEVLGIH
jgi:poly(hydroxyalkanoate) depolymerase family esterase